MILSKGQSISKGGGAVMTILKRIFAALLAALTLLLCGCQDITEHYQPDTVTMDLPTPEPPVPDDDGVYTVGELYGSYITMYIGHTPADVRGVPYIKTLTTYAEVEEYFDSTVDEHVYGRLFSMAMASFDDDFLAENDVLVLALEEPSSYINHSAKPIEISPEKVTINLERHIPEASPQLPTEYHLIFTAPKGGFSGIADQPLELNISEVIDRDNNSAFDADIYRIFRPGHTSFCYRADALTNTAGVVVDTIQSYDELVYFYNTYKNDFDLDSEFRGMIGTLYNWEICESYVLLATIIPCRSETEPEITDMFVNNLELFMTVEADEVLAGEKPAACYLLLTGIERRNLTGVDLGVLNLSVE